MKKPYNAKLSRVYLELNQINKRLSFAERLSDLLSKLEQQKQPDIVLLDSRAGLHDIAAITITRLNATALLFAVNTPQTWQGYRFLFNHWLRWGQSILPQFRENLKVVASMIPETDIGEYRARCQESAYDLFADTLYEKDDGISHNIFNFDVNASEAPHYPLEIYWSRAFLEFDPVNQPDFFANIQIQAIYGKFLEEATQYAFGSNS